MSLAQRDRRGRRVSVAKQQQVFIHVAKTLLRVDDFGTRMRRVTIRCGNLTSRPNAKN